MANPFYIITFVGTRDFTFQSGMRGLMNESVDKKNTFCSGRGLEFGS